MHLTHSCITIDTCAYERPVYTIMQSVLMLVYRIVMCTVSVEWECTHTTLPSYTPTLHFPCTHTLHSPYTLTLHSPCIYTLYSPRTYNPRSPRTPTPSYAHPTYTYPTLPSKLICFMLLVGTKNCKVIIIQFVYVKAMKCTYAFLKFGQLSR